MTRDSTVLPFQHPEEFEDPLTAVLRDGARRLLAQAVEAEAEAFLDAMREERLPDGRARVVRHGHGPERTIQTGIGPVPVKRVKLRDRGAGDAARDGGDLIFTSTILPKWARRTRSLDALLPVLYLRGISTGGFQDALAALLGKDAPNLSPSVVGRLKEDWQAEYDRWQRRDLSARRYVYLWADGVYLQARMEDGKTVCPPLRLRWLSLHCASEDCSDRPSRSSSQEDGSWSGVQRFSSGSTLPRRATRSR